MESSLKNIFGKANDDDNNNNEAQENPENAENANEEKEGEEEAANQEEQEAPKENTIKLYSDEFYMLMWDEQKVLLDQDKKKKNEEKKNKEEKDKAAYEEFAKKQKEELDEAKKDNKYIVYLQKCYDCERYKMHTRYSEEKYNKYMNDFIGYVNTNCGAKYHVAVNQLDMKKYWRMGCFDIYVQKDTDNGFSEACIYNKGEKGMWPSFKIACERIKEFYEGGEE